MDLTSCASLLSQQAGVLTRSQSLERGATQHDLDRWLRRNELAAFLPGVYLDHTGEPTWLQRAWAAVLSAEPAALARSSALRVTAGRPLALASTWKPDDPVHLLLGRGRHPVLPDWAVLHRCDDIDAQVHWTSRPPRQRLEDASIDIAADHLRGRARDAHLHAAAAVADPIQSSRTTPDRMLTTLTARKRVTGRSWLAEVIQDVADGSTTVLEQGFTRRVERPHGLPCGVRQLCQDTASGPAARDVLFMDRQIVELDGRAFHHGARARDRDLDRDLDAAVSGLGTVRLGWGQVFDRPCATAGKVALLLKAHGWRGEPRSCGTECVAPGIFRPAA